MRTLFIVLLGLLVNYANADTLLRLSPQQSAGITLTQLTPAHEIASAKFLAEVVVPTGQSRMLSAPQAGLVASLKVVTGGMVKAGEVLASLNSPQVLTLQREYFQAMSQQRLAQRNFVRDQELYQEGIIAERRYLESQSRSNEALALSHERRQSLLLAGMTEADIRQFETSGVYTASLQLRAPMSSVVLEQLVELGQRVEAATPIYRIAALNPLWLELSVPVEMGTNLKVGMLVRLVEHNLYGKILAVLPNLNKSNQALLVRVEVVQKQAVLRPGQWVQAHILLDSSAKNVWRVARHSLVRIDKEGDYVFVQTEGGFIAKSVQVLSREADSVLIRGQTLSGLEKVVLQGTATLKAQLRGTH